MECQCFMWTLMEVATSHDDRWAAKVHLARKLLSQMQVKLACQVCDVQQGMDLQIMAPFAGTCRMGEECLDDPLVRSSSDGIRCAAGFPGTCILRLRYPSDTRVSDSLGLVTTAPSGQCIPIGPYAVRASHDLQL
jgi:hypothetical protein